MTPPQRLVLTVAILGSFVAFLDSTIVNVAIPSIVDDLKITSTQVQWVQEAYTLVFASLLLLFGFGMIWFGILIGSWLRSVEAVNGFMFSTLFPITFLSNAFVPTEPMPTWPSTAASAPARRPSCCSSRSGGPMR